MEDTSGVLRFLLVGKTGSGKSSTGNTILGKDELFQTAFAAESATDKHQLEEGSVNGRKIEVVDTPGLFDTSKSEGETAEAIIQALSAVNPGPHAVLYVMRCDVRYSKEEYNTYGRLKKYLGETVAHHMIIILTYGDRMKKKKVTVQKFFEKAPQNLQSVYAECGERLVVFDNDTEDQGQKLQEVAELMKLVDLLPGSEYSGSPFSAVIEAEMKKAIEERVLQASQSEVEESRYAQQLKQNTDQAQKERDDAKAEAERNRKEAEKRARIALELRKEAARKGAILQVIVGASAAITCALTIHVTGDVGLVGAEAGATLAVEGIKDFVANWN